jgi:hypothetical protein
MKRICSKNGIFLGLMYGKMNLELEIRNQELMDVPILIDRPFDEMLS